MSPTERDALEAYLLAHPHDLAGHAAYADYLIEQDDERGEFIRWQLNYNPEADNNNEFEATLTRYGEALFHTPYLQIRPAMKPQDLRYGWLNAITLTRRTVAEVTIWRDAPALKYLRRLTIYNDGDPITFLRLFQHHQHLNTLIIHDDAFGHDELTQLLHMPMFGQLKSLDVSDCALTDQSADLLCNYLAEQNRPFPFDLLIRQNYLSGLGLMTLSEYFPEMVRSQQQRLSRFLQILPPREWI